MNRTHRLRRNHRRAAWIGFGASILFHVVALASARFDIQGLPSEPTIVRALAEPAPDVWRALEVVALQTPVQSVASEGAAVAAAAWTASAPAAAEALPGASLLPASPEPDGSTYNPLVVVDPMLDVQAKPIAFTDLPALETVTPEAVEPAVPLYQPGSVGKAKRQWASSGDGAAEKDIGRGWTTVVSTGGGHCPMPGRGRPTIGPWWLRSL